MGNKAIKQEHARLNKRRIFQSLHVMTQKTACCVTLSPFSTIWDPSRAHPKKLLLTFVSNSVSTETI
ncbi:hypothetical protein [Sporolactobacillus putidus]|uniref:Uncharacterized protein n=1 Tax=Sporolactobacillus putidus TaxID=492735 RepID=A0A917S1M4_9BACL|nr:hypothetical protein [Sporolactobacillus putidus]GGL50935.1 hypothetical protein GCM10007968_13960 [Sporolactobacillus putidus]